MEIELAVKLGKTYTDRDCQNEVSLTGYIIPSLVLIQKTINSKLRQILKKTERSDMTLQ